MVNTEKPLAENHSKAKLGFISGNFNILHAGHLRLFKFAKETVDILIIAVTNDSLPGVTVPQTLRMEALKHLDLVDEVIALTGPLDDLIRDKNPDIIIKGKEFELLDNDEERIVQEIGAKLIFSSGELIMSSSELIDQEKRPDRLQVYNNLNGYISRHKISYKNLVKKIQQLNKLKVLVIGDLIIDEYVFCDPIGMSQEDPTIVVKINNENQYIGGAGIVAAHAAALGAQVTYVGIAGKDSNANFARTKLNQFGVKTCLIEDATRPTITKRRFRAADKTLLRVNKVRDHDIEGEILAETTDQIFDSLPNCDVVLFSDFSYGLLTANLIENIVQYCDENRIYMGADSQSSSQLGDILKFKNMALITPTEREARLAIGDQKVSVPQVPIKLRSMGNAENILITMGSEGILISAFDGKEEFTDRLPALNSNPVDVAGAGDSLFCSASLGIAAGMNIWEASLLGSLSASVQVSKIGNKPLDKQGLIDELELNGDFLA